MISRILSSGLAKLSLWMIRRKPSVKCFGIRLIDANENPYDDQCFFSVTQMALSVVWRHDPIRFRRVRRFVATIVNTELLALGAYHATTRSCQIDFSRLVEQGYDGDELRDMVASTLVHEATHGLIRYRGVRRNQDIRVERLCRLEECRFLSGINSKLADRRAANFDPEAWRRIWRLPFWQRVRVLAKRVAEVRSLCSKAVRQTGANRIARSESGTPSATGSHR